MSENNNVEQPTNFVSDVDQVSMPEAGEFDPVSESGSTFGKFKDATSLLEAYKSLESEFTRKSQKLKEAMKKLEQVGEQSESNLSDGAAQEQSEGSTEKNQKSVSTENASRQEAGDAEAPHVTWKTRVEDFFLRTPEAKNSSKEIAKILKDQPELRKLENGIDIAFKMVKAESFSSPADLMKNPEFLKEHILNNDEIKNMVIKEYLDGAKAQTKLPHSFGASGSHVLASSSSVKPTNIESAGKIFEKMLKGS